MLLASLAAITTLKSPTSLTEIPLPSGMRVYVDDLNDRGQVCGRVQDGGTVRLFRAGAHDKPELQTLPGGYAWDDQAIGPDGTVLALRRDPEGPKVYRWKRNGLLETIAMPRQAEVWSPNSRGEYLFKQDHTEKGQMYVQRNGKPVPLRMPDGLRYTAARLKDTGLAFGGAYGPTTGMFTVVWDLKGAPSLVPWPKNTSIGDVVDVNKTGQFAGRAVLGDSSQISRPFVCSNGKVQVLPLPAGVRAESSTVLSLNNKGQMLCAAEAASGVKTFWLTDGKSTTLLPFDAIKEPGFHPTLLNNKGQVLFVSDRENPARAYLVSIR